MANVVKTVRSGNATLDSLLTEYHWSGSTLTYGIPRRGQWSGYDSGTEPYVFYEELNSAQEAAVQHILNKEIGGLINIRFTELWNEATQIPEAEKPTSADLRFGQTLYAPDGPFSAFAYLPAPVTAGVTSGQADQLSGDVWVYNDEEDTHPGAYYAAPQAGNYEYFAYLHEIGHAMGLKHPHEIEGIFGAMPLATDQLAYTVMSYRSYEGQSTAAEDGYANGDWDFPQTYMIWDIAALQYLYGSSFSFRRSDTIYKWNPVNGQTLVDGAVWLSPGANKIFMTVFDGGGIDTYDFSSYLSDLSVNLNAEAWTTTASNQLANLGDGHWAPGNIANARRSDNFSDPTIENAIGGAGNDTMIGNQVANRLTGNGGNDLLDGRAGADTLIGGAGNDRYLVDNSGDAIVEIGGEGDDSVDVSAITYILGDNVETMIGVHATAAQTLTGNGSDNLIRGNNVSGNTLSGAGGADRIEGGSGADKLVGGAGADLLFGNGGADRLEGGDDGDSLEGGLGDDILVGGGGADLILGGDGADRIVYLAVSDSLAGAIDHIFLFASGVDKIDLTALVISALSWSELTDPANSLVYSMVSVTSSGTSMSIRVDSRLVQGDFLIGQFAGPTEGPDTIDGTPGPDSLNGLGGNDIINALAGNDVIDGGSGSDSMRGGPGDDIYYVDSFGDGVIEQSGEGVDEVRTALAFHTLGANVENLTGTSNGGQSLTGNDSVNVIAGGGGDDVLDGRLGADSMTGGAGSDVYWVDDSGDLTIEAAGGGTDRVYSTAASYVLGANVENLTGVLGTGQSLTGNAGANIITGGAGDDSLDGGFGADALLGGMGSDLYFVDDAGDSVTELNGEGVDEVRTALASYSLGSNLEKLTGTSNAGQALTGNGLDNVIFGGTGNDLLDGGAGIDVLRGGMGNDVYVLDETGDNVAELADWGTDEVRTGLGYYALADHFENLTGTSSAGQMLIGNALSNVILGGSGDDFVDGGAGADVLRGGLGNDIYLVDDSGDNIDELPEGGIDEIRTGLATFSLFALGTFENLTGTSSLGQILEGNGLANVIVAGAGNDLLIGAGGADTLQGGLGNDIYFVEDAGDVVVELGGEGSDEIRTALGSYSLAGLVNVENLTGLGSGDQNLTGNGAANIIDGGLGADTMTGGLGNDIYIVDNGGDVVVELSGEGTDEIRTSLASFSLLGLANIENLTAVSNANHDFRGNAGNNFITGAGGNDFLRLQDGGIDTVIGGGGNDVILFGATLTSADSVDGGTGIDQAVIQGDYSGGLTLGANFVSIESFAILPGSDTRFGDPGTNFYDYNLTTVNGNVAAGVTMVVDANRLRIGEDFTFNGSAETDGGFFIYGGGGTDTLLGGSGNDTFYFGENGQFGASDTANGGAGGIDQLGLRGNYTITFGAGQLTSIESMGLVSAQDTRFGGLGTAYNYNLTMNDGNVAAGVRMTVDAAPLRGAETLTFDGSAETDGSFRIFGGQGGDTIKGSQGNDLITGGTGADNLWGGGGNDSFIYRTAADSTSAARDTIHDFSSGDLLNLVQIDAIAGGGNDAFTFIGSAAFTNTAGQLRAVFDGVNNVWTVQGDVNGDGVADLEFIVSSDHPLVGGDFVL